MKKISFITISRNGTVKTFAGDFPALESMIKNKSISRISRVVPQNLILRFFFMLIRRFFNDNHPFSHWTRRWKCKWIVIIHTPDNQCRRFGPFQNRQDAILFERKLLSSHLQNIKFPIPKLPWL